MSLPVKHLPPRASLFATFDPRWKLAAMLPACGAISAMRSPLALLTALGLSLLLAAVARVPGHWFRARIGVLLLALLPFLIVLPLTVDRGGSSLELAGVRLSVAGLVVAVGLMGKTLAISTLMLVVLATAPLHVTLRAAQRLYVPGPLVLLTMLSYRYAFLLLEELNRLRVALRVRGFRNRANRHSYRTIGRTTGTLLVRGAERAERVSHAMRCRGFDGTFRSLHEFQTTARDVAIFLLIGGAFIGLLAGDRWLAQA